MSGEIKQTIKVLSSQTDMNTKVGLIESCSFFQDNMCEFFGNLKCDGLHLVPLRHAFWAITKNKIRFNGDACWLDTIELTTRLTKLSGVRLNLESKIEKSGVSVAECLQELCAMDSDTRKLRLISSIPELPSDIEVNEKSSDLEFEKLDFELTENDFVKEKVVDANNIDFFGHTNNIEYVRFMYGTIPPRVIKSFRLKEFEIHYLKESRESDKLRIYKREENSDYLFEIRKEDVTLCKAILKFEN